MTQESIASVSLVPFRRPQGSHLISTHPLPSQLSSPHYLVVENLRGPSHETPFVWDADHTTGNVVGMARSYPVARTIIPTPCWPSDAGKRTVLERHFPSHSIALSCGGVVDQPRALSFDDHPSSLAGPGQDGPRDRSLFGRTYTILWMAAGDETEIAAAMVADQDSLAAYYEQERERFALAPWMYAHRVDSIIDQWFNDWYLSRLCRLAGQPMIDVERVRHMLTTT
ncbi:hypothetical protein [Allorhodopirellula heiligendammensis]|uniref:Uncharacterized protein n=1 Tax=Allorhodopirellula heiligendammensis TaxID=2714739 RepID=A0A5C6C571_9BACT|nr:hypothetical protein [Allorhodopirellula heiligendammensis]TWU18606.1 hypothetical protein Poly21_07700 [Allorhodopirellula heiligendammensis]